LVYRVVESGTVNRKRQPSSLANADQTFQTEKVPALAVKRIREAILDGVYKPGDHLVEVELAENSKSERSEYLDENICIRSFSGDHLSSSESTAL
jgi:hypothetical protein